MAKQLHEAPEGAWRHGSDGASDLGGMVQQVVKHFTLQERQELEKVLDRDPHLFSLPARVTAAEPI